MAVSLGTNLLALGAERSLARGSSALSRVMERLSSGTRINRPSDDAAGLAVSSSLRLGARVFQQGIRNINDGISAINIADGALDNLSNVVIRQRELAVQAANGSLSVTQRISLNAEANQLVDEFNRILKVTSLNGLGLLGGNFGDLRIQGEFGLDGSIGFAIGNQLESGTGNGTFSSGANYASTGTSGTGAVLVDLNNDGRLDLVGTTGNGATTARMFVRLGNGDGTFGSQSNIAAVSMGNFDHLVSGDFNGDGLADVAVSYGDTGGDFYGVSVYHGNGAGGFSAPVVVGGGGTFVTDLQAADFNGDGRTDLTFTDGSTLWVYRNNDTSYSQMFLSAGSYSRLAIGDMNGDGRADIAARDSVSSFRIFQNANNFQFSIGSSISAGGNFNSLTAADINRDGYADIVTDSANSASIQARILLNQGGTSFTTSTISGTVASAGVQLRDLNGDGNLDLVSVNSSGQTYTLFYGNGTGSFSDERRASVSGTSAASGEFALGDVNGDGSLDIVTSETAAGAGRNSVILQGATRITSQAYLNLTSIAGARDAMSALDARLRMIALERGALGANLSRFEAFLNTLSAKGLAYQDAEGRIKNTDMADDSAQLARLQILQQAGAAVLAQAGTQPTIALRLLSL